MADEHISPGNVLFLVLWLGLLATGLGYLLFWLNSSVWAYGWIRKRRPVLAAMATLPVRAAEVSVAVISDHGDLLRSATTMWAGLMQDGRELGRRQRIKVVADGIGVRVAQPAIFDPPEVPFDEVGLFDRASEHGGEPLVRMSRFLVADEFEDGKVHVGEPDPW